MSEKKSKIKKTLFDLPILQKIKAIKNIEIIVAIVIISIIILIYFSSFSFKGTSSSEFLTLQADDYANQLDTRLENTLKNISGAGEINVMVTLESGTELVIATSKDQKTNTSTSSGTSTENITIVENPIVITQNGESVPLILKEILPAIKGVVIVSQGASNVRVRLDLMNAVKALLDVQSDQIQIFVGK